MRELALDPIIFVSVVGVVLSLEPIFSCHNALCFAVSSVKLSLHVLELSKVHVLDTFPG